MSFRDIDIKISYDSLSDSIAEDFYIPTLKEARIYKRAVGFFSSTILLELTKGLSYFVKNGGKIELLISPKLSKDDYEAIESGYSVKDKVENNLIDNFDEFIEYEQKEDRFGMLSYLIRNNVLDVKVLVLEKYYDRAMFHEKTGLLYDNDNNCIMFTGSQNDSVTALNYNSDTIEVFCSWKFAENKERCIEKEERFNKMWNGNFKGLITIPFPDIIKEKLLKYENPNSDYSKLDDEFLENINKKMLKSQNRPNLSMIDGLRNYQKEAISNWVNSNYRGIFDMATGTGKTYTGCGAISKLYKDKKRLFVIICCPYVHLVEQWVEEVKNFGIIPISCYSGIQYEKRLERAVRNFKYKNSDFECIVLTNGTFSTEKIQKLVIVNLKDTVLIVDEAHNFGAPKLRKLLNIDYPYRLALSATLERHGDKIGTQALYDFFGQRNIIYSLEEAIRNKFLTSYYYYPIIVALTESERDEYRELSTKISKLSYAGLESEPLKRLLIKRARLIAGAKNKVFKLEKTLQKHLKDNNMLIYCGAIKYDETNDNEFADDKKQIELVLKMLNDNNIKALKFTSEENVKERVDIISAFKNKLVQALVAIRCLDEGVNIPAIRTAFILASSTNPKEYIQRRGRVLRQYKDKEFAVIYDFITLPFELDETNYYGDDILKQFKGLIRREFVRLLDFAYLAKNTSYSNDIIDEIKKVYKIDVIDIDEEIDIYE